MEKILIQEMEITNNKSKEQIDSENEKLTKELGSMTVMVVDEKDRSINFGVVGVGQGGSKIAEQFYQRGYNTVVINTALQDLKYIQVPEKNKLLLDTALGGAAKDLDTGRMATEQYSEQILTLLQDNFADNEVLLLAVCGGGGTGSGSAETMVSLMSQLGKPLAVMYILPLSSEDTLSKYNSVQTLSKLAVLAKKDIINSLMIVDNMKIELLYPGKSVSDFWKVANNAIVEPLHLLNKLSSVASPYTSLDSMDFARVFVGTGDCALYGMLEVEDYIREESIAEAVLTNLKNGLLASEFDLTTARAAGVIITGSKQVLEQIPSTNVEYGFAVVNKLCHEGTVVYKGLYEVEGQDSLKVYSLFSGLGLPEERISELKTEAERHMASLKNKEENRSANMHIDIGKTVAVNAVDQLHKKIMNKNSAMGKLAQNSKRLVDMRKR